MARYRKNRMSLYEAMSQSQRKSGYGKLLEKLRGFKPPQKTERPPSIPLKSETPAIETTETTGLSAVTSAKAEAKSDVGTPRVTTTWFRRPRAVQFNTSRIEFSLSYPVVIAVLLGLILLFLLMFRAGQYYSFTSRQPPRLPVEDRRGGANPSRAIPAQPEKAESASVRNVTDLTAGSMADKTPAETKVEPVAAPPAVASEGPAALKAGNVIVIVEYFKKADLVPVQKHFAKNGIETEIVNWDGKCFLITRDRYDGFGPDSDGYKAKQKIVEVGALYKGKAPEGYETFAPLFFKDAYGRKVE